MPVILLANTYEAITKVMGFGMINLYNKVFKMLQNYFISKL